MKTMKKALALIIVLTLMLSLSATSFAAKDDPIKIGISIWSSTDTLGSEVKRMIDAAAETLGVETTWVDQAHISEQVTASAETLALADCDGIIICNSASAEMGSVIKTCDENEMYVAQFFRVIDPEANPDEYKMACESPYYVGAVHESEVDNGKTLVTILGQQGHRKIGLEGWEPGDATFLGRWEGYKAGVEAWNEEHPDDKLELLEPQYGGTTTDTGRKTAEAIIQANPDIDALIVAGGGRSRLWALSARFRPFPPTSCPIWMSSWRTAPWRRSPAVTTPTRSLPSCLFTMPSRATMRFPRTVSMRCSSRTCLLTLRKAMPTMPSISPAPSFRTTPMKSPSSLTWTLML